MRHPAYTGFVYAFTTMRPPTERVPYAFTSVNVRIFDSTGDENSDYVHVMCAGLQNILFEETDYVVDTGHSVILAELHEQNEEKIKQGQNGIEGNNIILFNKNKLN